MKNWRRATLAATALMMAVGVYSESPQPVDAWRLTEDGEVIFDGKYEGQEYVWLYHNHTWPRRFLFTIEQMAAPHLARDNAVAWAYPVEDVPEDRLETFSELLNDERIALALRKTIDDAYHVLPNSLRDEFVNNAERLGELSESLQKAELWSAWVVSPEKYEQMMDASGVERISSRSEIPVERDDWEAMQTEIMTIIRGAATSPAVTDYDMPALPMQNFGIEESRQWRGGSLPLNDPSALSPRPERGIGVGEP